MITDPAYFESYKRRAFAGENLSIGEKFRILESLYQEARQLGKFDDADVLEGLDDTIRLAAALNARVPGPDR